MPDSNWARGYVILRLKEGVSVAVKRATLLRPAGYEGQAAVCAWRGGLGSLHGLRPRVLCIRPQFVVANWFLLIGDEQRA